MLLSYGGVIKYPHPCHFYVHIHVHVCATCLGRYCSMDIDKQHVQTPRTCTMDMQNGLTAWNMQYRPAGWTNSTNMHCADKDMGHGNEAWTCSIDMQNGRS
jgi:hypothetical protein